MVLRIQKDQTEAFKKLRECFTAPTKREMIARYHQVTGFGENTEEFLELVKKHKLSRSHLFSLLIDHLDLSKIDFYTFELGDIAEKLQCDVSHAKNLLKQLSFKPGELIGFDFNHLFMGSPMRY